MTELTYLSADVSSGISSISVDNAQGFATDDYVIIENIGSETAEIKKIATVVGTVITLSAPTISFDHKKGAQVQKTHFNERWFYRATSESGPWGVPIATRSIEVDRPDGTFYEDTTGTSSHWYKATYYNVATGIETSLDDAVATKAAESEHYTSLFDIRRQSGFEEAYGLRDKMIADYRDEAENEFESAIVTIYAVPLIPKPKIARQIVNFLAAGNLLIKEYGMEADIEISKSGQRMLDRAYELIGKIVDGKLKVVDDDGDEIGTKSSATLAGTSNDYNLGKMNTGEIFTLEDEKFRAANPDTGAGATH